MQENAHEEVIHTPLVQRLGAILWPSFFCAGLAIVLLFAFVEPEVLLDSIAPDMEITRMTAYALTFFFFWVFTCASSLFTLILLKPCAQINKH